MATITSTFYRDANRVPITTDGIITKRTITFTGAAGSNTWGDDGGTLDGGALFTVTGLIYCKLIAVCKTLLDSDGAATISIGTADSATLFMPAETATQIDAEQIWFNDAGNATYGIIGAESAAAGNLPEYALNGNDIILTVAGAANVTAGVLDFYLLWQPISDDASVVATTT